MRVTTFLVEDVYRRVARDEARSRAHLGLDAAVGARLAASCHKLRATGVNYSSCVRVAHDRALESSARCASKPSRRARAAQA
jgi:hypothetical protein